ncbi:MAG TPA: hypothetical protein VMW65_15685, partial [Chloroflexota bacterium]|nr:hypothetical protein [Chloroflexota bacterium]
MREVWVNRKTMMSKSRPFELSVRSVKRRSILGWALGGSAGALLAACSSAPAAPTSQPAAATTAGQSKSTPSSPPTTKPASTTSSQTAAAPTQAAASTAAPAASAAKSAATGTVDFTHWLIGGSQGVPTAKQIDQLWAQQHPAITLKDEIPSGNYWTAVLTRLAGGDPPDAMAIDNYNITALAVKG